jgi:hypothetical protein
VFSHADDGEVAFHEASELSVDHARTLEPVLQRCVLRYFRRRGLLDEADAADMLTWRGTGGFSVDASVRIEGEDRTGLERLVLVRYCARPPFALERLHAFDSTASLVSPEARLLYRLPKPDLDGRTELVPTPLELLKRIARLIPPPRVHRTATTACWLRMRSSARPSSPSAGPTRSHPPTLSLRVPPQP